MAKPTLHFRNISGPQLAGQAESILVKLSENHALFPDPDPGLATLESALAGFNRALADAAFRDMRQVAIKNTYFKALKKIIFELSLYVTKISKGDPAVIFAAGFLPSKTAAPVGPAPKPQYFRAHLLTGNPGHVHLRVQVWRKALVYQFEYRKAGKGAPWQAVLSSKSNLILPGLDALDEYEFRVAYINRDPQVTHSDVVRMYVL